MSDSFVKDGYMQEKGGYIDRAKKEGIVKNIDKAEPNQKWHLLKSYYLQTDINSDAQKCYNSLLCPELLLWIAEAAGFDVEVLSKEAKRIIDAGYNGHARSQAGRHIKRSIKWEMIAEKIIQAKR